MLTQPTDPEVKIESFGGTYLVQLPALLNLHYSVQLVKQIRSIYLSSPSQKLILDFGKTAYVDSSGIGALISVIEITRDRQIDLVCWSISAPVKTILSAAHLDQVLCEAEGTAAIAPHKRFVSTQLAQASSLQQVPHPSVTCRSKRFIDIVGALIGLGITAILFIPIAIAIKVDNPGSIFYSQIRCSWMGKRFRIWKFRSMVANAEQLKHLVTNEANGKIFKNRNDPRITKVGRFLRRTSLDELPQFWNVLKGEMSLVGTRPPTVDEVSCYNIADWQRLNVKPGLTGHWQVNGRSKVTNFEDIVQLDLQYQQHWSLRYDLQIILKTILILFSRDGGAV